MYPLHTLQANGFIIYFIIILLSTLENSKMFFVFCFSNQNHISILDTFCVHLYTAYPIAVNFIKFTIRNEEYKQRSSSLCSFLHISVPFFHLGSSIFHNTHFQFKINLRTSLYMSDRV
jgi:hypothetical protein